MKRIICILLAAAVLYGCSAGADEPSPTTTQATTVETTECTTAPTQPPDPIELLLDSMTLEELVGQLFLARYPDSITAAEAIQKYHIGSFLLFSKDFESSTPTEIRMELDSLQTLSCLPLIFAVDEEGGAVTRISCHRQYRKETFSSPRKLYNQGGLSLLLETEKEKCELLRNLGIHVNLAPVCDIATKKSAFMYSRSLRQSPEETGKIITEMLLLMEREQIGSVLKHFPGYGNNKDTHKGIAVDNRSLQELEQADLIPFFMGISAGCQGILISHTIVNCLDNQLPASLSPDVITYLRQTMGFNGVIVSDDLVMDAISDQYGTEEAAVLAVLAGNDLLCSSEYAVQYSAVLSAAKSGRIPPERVRESAARVLRWKADLGLSIA